MRVLMLAPEPFFEPRGTPYSVYQRLLALSALGHETDLLTYHVGQEVDIPLVNVHRIPAVPFVRQVKVGPSWAKPVLDSLLLLKAIWMLLRGRYDVIHSHEEASFFAMVIARLFRVRHIYDMHSSLPRQLASSDYGHMRVLVRLFEYLEKRVLQTCDAVITVGADLEDYVRQINPAARNIRIENLALQLSHNGQDKGYARRLKLRLGIPDKQTIVYTGTFEPYQGLDLLLESAVTVIQNNPRAHFVLVGGKPGQVSEQKLKAADLELDGHISFVGSVPPREAMAYLDIADVLVSPRIDGTTIPLKIYSYLHAGKAVVATTMPAHSLVLNDDIAVLVEPEKEALARGILKLLEDPDLRSRLGNRARSYAENNHSFEHYLEKMKALYCQTSDRPSIKNATAVLE